MTCLAPCFLSAVHFCSARDRRWINPHVFAESLAFQLSARYTAYAKNLAEKRSNKQIHIELEDVEIHVGDVVSSQVGAVIIKKLDVGGLSPEDSFICIVREPLEALFNEKPDKQVVILVDALDESLIYGEDVGIVPLVAQADELPRGVRFIVTSRQDERVESELRDVDGLFLSAARFDPHNQEDIGNYVRTRFRHDKPLALKAAELDQEKRQEMESAITEKATGNFQYVRFLLDSMANGLRPLTQLEGLPSGLDGLYLDSLRRVVELGDRGWEREFSPLMGVLSVAQERLTLDQLKNFTGHTESAIWRNVGRLQQFVPIPTHRTGQGEEEDRYHLYHQSFVDFLHQKSLRIEKRRLRNPYYVSAEEWHGRIIDYFVQNFARRWSTCDIYALRHLAMHMVAGGRHKDLYGLLVTGENQNEWAEAHLEVEGSYFGYLTDIDLAWSWAEGLGRKGIGKQIRCALLRASVLSLATDIPPKLPAYLVESKIWSVTVALSHIRQMPDQWQRDEAIGWLAPHLPNDLKAEMPREALTTACSMDGDNCMEMLGALAPSLSHDLKAQALAMTRSMDRSYCILVLSTLAPHLPDDLMAEALAVARGIEGEEYWARAMGVLVPHLPDDLMAEALAVARGIEGEEYWARAMGVLVPHLPDDLKAEVLNEALAKAQGMRNRAYRAWMLGILAPHMPGDLGARVLKEALATAKELPDIVDRTWVFSVLAPHLPEDLKAETLREALATAMGSDLDGRHLRAMQYLIPLLPDVLSSEVLEEALASAGRIDVEMTRFHFLKDLAPYLPNDFKVMALEVAERIGLETVRGNAVSGLAPYLPDDLKVRALATVKKISEKRYRARALCDLAPHLPNSLRNESLREALAAAQEIWDEEYQIFALGALAPYLSHDMIAEILALARDLVGPENKEILDFLAPHLPDDLMAEALAVARGIEGEEYWARVLGILAPHLPDDLIREALAVAVGIRHEESRVFAQCVLAPYLPKDLKAEAMSEVIALARETRNEERRGEVLSLLAPHLPDDLKAEALVVAREIEDDTNRGATLCRIALHLPDEIRTAELKEALATLGGADRRRGFALVDVLSDLAQFLPNEMMHEALAVAREIDNEKNRARALGILAPHLPDDLMREALAVAREIDNEKNRARALGILAPHLPDDLRTGVFREALAALRTIDDSLEMDRAEVLGEIATHLPAEMIPEVLAMARRISYVNRAVALCSLGSSYPNYRNSKGRLLEEALATAREVDSASSRQRALCTLAPSWIEQTDSHFALSLWLATLPVLANRGRSDLLKDLRDLASVVFALGGQSSVVDTAQAILDVGRWWP